MTALAGGITGDKRRAAANTSTAGATASCDCTKLRSPQVYGAAFSVWPQRPMCSPRARVPALAFSQALRAPPEHLPAFASNHPETHTGLSAKSAAINDPGMIL